MRILLDECVHAGIKTAFSGHAVKTVTEIGWRSSKDQPLLAYAQENFEVFVTIDRKLEHQHNIEKQKLGIVMAHVMSNEIEFYQPIFEALLKAAETVKAGEILHVYAPQFKGKPPQQ